MENSGPQTESSEPVAEWVRLYGRAVRGYLLAMVRRPEEADELAQEVFLRAWQARQRYREQGNARAYLLRIADRLVCDRSRRSGRETTLDEDHWKALEPASRDGDPSGRVLRAEAHKKLYAALELLSPIQQRVLLLRYHGQLGFAEIAETVGCPLGTVLSHCHRGLKSLRTLLVDSMP